MGVKSVIDVGLWLRLVDSGSVSESRMPDGRALEIPHNGRDFFVDLAAFTLAAGYGVVTALSLSGDPSTPEPMLIADQIIGALGCTALWLRRRWPVGLALALVPFAAFTLLVQGAMVVALFAVAVRRPFQIVASVGVLTMVTGPIYYTVRPDPTLPFAGAVALTTVIYLAAIGWGMFVRSRRELILSIRAQADRAVTEAYLRAEQARRLERERIAREMHDVLAHRLSLLSVYAGALEYRPDAPSDEIARAAGVIRDSTHQALQDVREVIGLLRIPIEGVSDEERPQPTLARLPQLVEESRLAGMDVTLHNQIDDLTVVSGVNSRSAYRIAQEGLTNARKHAPGAPVTVTVSGGPDDGLTVELVNQIPVNGAKPDIPGTGQGLIGMVERATLAGGRLEHGRTPTGDFRLSAWLPWSA
jgi:signal transduction histidine kinase